MNKKFYVYITARFISAIGNEFQTIAFPFAILALTGSALLMTLSFVINIIPTIILGTVSGHLVDKFSRKNILITCDLIRGVILILYISYPTKNIILLYLLNIIISGCGMIYSVGCSSFFPSIVGNEMSLKKANAIESFFLNISMILVPIVAGGLIFQKGVYFGFLINGITFILSGFFLLFLNKDERIQENDEQNLVRKSLMDLINLKKIISVVKENKIIEIIIIISSLFFVCGSIFMSLDAIYVSRVFKDAPLALGYINTAWGIGMVVASLLIILLKKVKEEKLFFISIFLMGIATIGYGLSEEIWLSSIFNFMGGIANTLFLVNFRTIIQKNSNDTNRGKIFAGFSIISQVCSLLILGVTGAMADVLGVGVVIAIAGALCLVITIGGLLAYQFNISRCVVNEKFR